MIPRDLDGWTVETILGLLRQHVLENECFDFKLALSPEKSRLAKACAAFANSGGGFFIFGVSDDRTRSARERLVGIDPTIDFGEQFGVVPAACAPSVDWGLKNPPLLLENGRVLHVVQIEGTWRGPHASRGDGETLHFVKRTNKGVEPMSLEEIRGAFTRANERRVKLVLLMEEIRTIAESAATWEASASWAVPSLELGLLEALLPDVILLIAEDERARGSLAAFRTACRYANHQVRLAETAAMFASMSAVMVQRANHVIRGSWAQVAISSASALEALEQVKGASLR
jgi:hypothetical protein